MKFSLVCSLTADPSRAKINVMNYKQELNMAFKITEIKDYGFTVDEIEFLTVEFLSAISKIKLGPEHTALIDSFELPELDCIIIATYKKINKLMFWEGKVFRQEHTLIIVANIE
jgi:hypothetical protein